MEHNIVSGSESLTNPTTGVTVGTATTTPPAALTVRGDEMATPTGDVFLTNSTVSPSAWRMQLGGSEMGNLSTTGLHFEMSALVNDLRFNTNGVNRVRIRPNGNMGVGDFNAGVPTPMTLLHIDNAGINFALNGSRNWMRTGLGLSEGSDFSYFGMRNEQGFDERSTVITWSDNAGGNQGPDRLKFIFTTGMASNIASSNTGLEAARVVPDASGDESYFGIGDWFTTGTNVDPTERLDLLDGRLRIRELPNDPETQDPFLVMVVDNTNDPLERGVVKWKDPSSFGGGGGIDCDWEVQPTDDVSTAYLGGPQCPQQQHGVGIGVDYPRSKLHVFHNDFTWLNSNRTATWSHVEANNSGGFSPEPFVGVHGESGPPANNVSGRVIGTIGEAYNSKSTTGVLGHAWFNVQGAQSAWVVGVHGKAELMQTIPSLLTVGVYGEVQVPAGTPNAWAMYSNGRQYSSSSSQWWFTSDEQVKTNIAEMQGALEKVLALSPKTYNYLQDAVPQLHFDEGLQYGLLAQELEEVFPEMVAEMEVPAEFDSTGVEVAPSIQLKAVNYGMMTPVLIGAIKEQQLQVTAYQEQLEAQQVQIADLTEQVAINAAASDELYELRDRMDQLEQLLAACCQNPDGGQRDLLDDGSGLNEAGDRNLRIQPNPFNEQTTIYYNLERSGRMQLMANSSDGKQLRVLHEAQMEAGQYQYEWQTADLNAGIYYVTLLLDGEPIVKKAVKVN